MNLESQKNIIDVFLPTYNRPTYLRVMIESLLNQTFKNFNLIILDNGSTNETFDVIKSFKDKRISYIRNEENDREFINYPFINSKSKFFIIVHDDDILKPNFLEYQLEIILKDSQINLLASRINLIDSNGNTLHKIRPRLFDKKNFWKKEEFIRAYFLKGDFIPFPTIIYRNNFIKKNKLNLEFKVGPAVDLYLLFKCNLKKGKIKISDKPLYDYRIHETQDSELNRLNLEYEVRPHVLNLLSSYKNLKDKYDKASISFIFHILIHQFLSLKIDFNTFFGELKKAIKEGLRINKYSVYWGFIGLFRGLKTVVSCKL